MYSDISFNHAISSIKRNVASFKPFIPPPGECLKVIEIDVRIDNVQFKDRFEWDINDINNNPEVNKLIKKEEKKRKKRKEFFFY